MEGTVKWYDGTKGYGFISTEEGNDVFVHRSGISNSMASLEPGQSVTFETKQGDRGLIAIEVQTK